MPIEEPLPVPDLTPVPVPVPTPTIIPGLTAMENDESHVAGPLGSGTIPRDYDWTPRPTPDSPRYDPYASPFTLEERVQLETDHVGVPRDLGSHEETYADVYTLCWEWNSGRSSRG